jgi:hypothetical protein
MTAAIGAGEQPRLSAKSDAAQCSLGSVVAQADSAVIDETAEGGPALEHGVDRPGHFGGV